MGARIGVVDYEMGNLRSVSKALEESGGTVQWVDSPRDFSRCDGVVLPGVGAFSVAVKNLRRKKLLDPIRNWIAKDKPFLGICLGYQLLFEEGREGREKTAGLGVFAGDVVRFPKKKALKVPHMGWNQIRRKSEPAIFAGIPDGSYFYFVHSYFPVPQRKDLVSTTTDYGTRFASSIAEGNLFACQFHPEKSGRNGLRLLKNFVNFL